MYFIKFIFIIHEKEYKQTENQKRIFSKNLTKLLSERGLTQIEVAKAINVSAQTFNTWCQGIAIPRMGKIELLAEYFHINKSDLIDDKKENDGKRLYYLDPETAAVAQKIVDNMGLKVLFDASEDADASTLNLAAEMVKKMKETNPDE